MSKLPDCTCDEAIKAIESAGFAEDSRSANHCILKKPGHLFLLSIPNHGKKSLKKGLLRAQIKNAGLTVEQFIGLLHPQRSKPKKEKPNKSN